MDKKLDSLLLGMKDAGCGSAEIKEAERLFEAGSMGELRTHLRRCRSELVEEMHESQKRVDRIDWLIRETGKIN